MKRTITLPFTLTALCLLALPSLATDVPIGAVLMGKVAPLTIKLGDITPQWSQFSISQGKDQAPNLQLDLNEIRIEQSYFNSYFTKGETVSSGSETFLLAYCRPNPLKPMIKEGVNKAAANDYVDPTELIVNCLSVSKETPLNLCLLNLKDAGNFLDIHPANIQEEYLASETVTDVMEKARQKAYQAASMSNLRQLALAANMYATENEETLPTLNSEKTWLAELNIEQKLTKQPVTGETYRANAAISGKSLGEIPEPTSTPLFYENTEWPDGKRIAAFVDGHVELMSKESWQEIAAKWNLK